MTEVVAGVDIGGTNTVTGLVDKDGAVLCKENLSTADYPDVNDFVAALTGLIHSMVSGKKNLVLKGIGIGAPDANYYKGTIELATNLAWKGIVPLVQLISEKVRLPVIMTNDANAAALGEMIFGDAKGINDFILLTLGTGLGSGIVINGEIVYGHTGFAGELGHMIVVPGGRDCGCGRQGCLETYVSAPGLVRTVIHLLNEMKEESPLRKMPPSAMTSKMIAEAAAAGDTVAVNAFSYTAEMLGLGIINSIVFSSPRTVFLFGGLANAGDLLFIPVRKYVDRNIMPLFKGSVDILPSGIEEANAAVLGAAALAWNELKK